MSGKLSRSKGQRAERALAKWLRARGYPNARRGVTQSRGAEQCDVEGTEWWIEVKSGANVEKRIAAACRQAVRDTDGRPCAVVWRGQGGHHGRYGPWRVAMAVALSDEVTRGIVGVCRAGRGTFAVAGRLWIVSELEALPDGGVTP